MNTTGNAGVRFFWVGAVIGCAVAMGCSREPVFQGPKPGGQQSPRDLLGKWYSSIDSKDRQAFYECYWGTDEKWADAIDALYSSYLASLDFRRALRERFGGDAWARYKEANEGLGIVVKTPPPDNPSWVDGIDLRQESRDRAEYLPYPNEEVPALSTWQTMIQRDGVWVLTPPKNWNANEASQYLERVKVAMEKGRKLVSQESVSLDMIKRSISEELGYR